MMAAQSLTARKLARMIDISAVQAWHGESQIRELVKAARQYRFAAVHGLPNWTSLIADLLKDDPDILVGGPVGFPSGGHTTAIKMAEARGMIADGVQELDMMINVGRLKSGDLSYVTEDISAVVRAAAGIPVKVILETHYLDASEIRAASLASVDAGAAFIKTSTGWTPGGATIETVSIIAEAVGGRAKIKAAGGIRDLRTVSAMIALGVERFGINIEASRRLIEECASLPGGALEVQPAPARQ
jgi:deoxyribose-phosphate aldolase